jgi:RimJ/RimL family protein N-acetyltransferase
MERLGMRREGHTKQSMLLRGEWVDEYHYAILQSEWRLRQSV